MQNSLQLTTIDNETLVSSDIIAQSLEIETRSVLRLIDRYSDNLKQFGTLRFEITPPNQKKTYYLNENQALLIGSFSKNTSKVVEFKEALIQAYSQLKNKELTRKELLLLALEAEEQRERLEKENKAQLKVIEDQNKLNDSMMSMKATQSRTALKALKDDVGVEINLYVSKLFPDVRDYAKKHRLARELYQRMTGQYYPGATKASLESKKDYLRFLKEKVNQLGYE